MMFSLWVSDLQSGAFNTQRTLPKSKRRIIRIVYRLSLSCPALISRCIIRALSTVVLVRHHLQVFNMVALVPVLAVNGQATRLIASALQITSLTAKLNELLDSDGKR